MTLNVRPWLASMPWSRRKPRPWATSTPILFSPSLRPSCFCFPSRSPRAIFTASPKCPCTKLELRAYQLRISHRLAPHSGAIVIRLLAISLLALFVSAAASAQQIKVDVNLVSVAFSVRDSRGALVANLTQDDVSIYEDD